MSAVPSLKTIMVSAWLEGVAYGVFACAYGWTCVAYRSHSQRQTKSARNLGFSVMLGFSTVMFSFATIHAALVGYHLVLQASIPQTSSPLDILKEIVLRTGVNTWWMVAYTVIYVTQELLGSAAAIYRTWLLWERDWRVMVIPSVLMLLAIGIGYVPTALFYILPPSKLLTDHRLPSLVTTFYILTVVMNIISTSLLVYPIWSTHRKVPRPNSKLASQIQHATRSHSVLPHVMRIVIESAMLQLVVEGILLVTFIIKSEAQYILLSLVVPIVGITFTLITLRIKFVVHDQDPGVSSGAMINCPRDLEEHPTTESGSFFVPSRVACPPCPPTRVVFTVSDQQSIAITEDLNLEHDSFVFHRDWDSTTRWSV